MSSKTSRLRALMGACALSLAVAGSVEAQQTGTQTGTQNETNSGSPASQSGQVGRAGQTGQTGQASRTGETGQDAQRNPAGQIGQSGQMGQTGQSHATTDQTSPAMIQSGRHQSSQQQQATQTIEEIIRTSPQHRTLARLLAGKQLSEIVSNQGETRSLAQTGQRAGQQSSQPGLQAGQQPGQPSQQGQTEVNATQLGQTGQTGQMERLGAQDQQFTLLAPTDDAFQAFGQEKLQELQSNPEKLREVLASHLITSEIGPVTGEALAQGGTVQAADGTHIQVQFSIGGVTPTDAIDATNGVVYVVDEIVTRERLQASATTGLRSRTGDQQNRGTWQSDDRQRTGDNRTSSQLRTGEQDQSSVAQSPTMRENRNNWREDGATQQDSRDAIEFRSPSEQRRASQESTGLAAATTTRDQNRQNQDRDTDNRSRDTAQRNNQDRDDQAYNPDALNESSRTTQQSDANEDQNSDEPQLGQASLDRLGMTREEWEKSQEQFREQVEEELDQAEEIADRAEDQAEETADAAEDRSDAIRRDARESADATSHSMNPNDRLDAQDDQNRGNLAAIEERYTTDRNEDQGMSRADHVDAIAEARMDVIENRRDAREDANEAQDDQNRVGGDPTLAAAVGRDSSQPGARNQQDQAGQTGSQAASAQFQNSQNQTVVQVVTTNPQFTTLRQLLTDSGLMQELSKGEKQYTLFAPTNDAFSSLEGDQLQQLRGNPEQLKQVLRYHIIQDKKIASKDLEGTQQVKTLEGTELKVTKQGETVMVGDARVTRADVQTRDGVIHVVNRLVMPDETVAQLRQGSEDARNRSTNQPGQTGQTGQTGQQDPNRSAQPRNPS